jgi:hypothetical protein
MGNYYTHVRAMHPEELAFSDFYNKSNTTSSQIRRRYITKIKTILAAATTISEVQVLNPLQVWKDMEVSAPNLCRAAIEMLSIPAQSAASERIFSVMNCVVTKSRCSLKQKNIGPLVQSAMRYKQQRVRKRLVMSNTEDFPPLGLLRLDETQDLIDDNMSDVTYHSLASDLDDDVDEVQAHPNTAEAEDEADYDDMVHDFIDGDGGGDDS